MIKIDFFDINNTNKYAEDNISDPILIRDAFAHVYTINTVSHFEISLDSHEAARLRFLRHSIR